MKYSINQIKNYVIVGGSVIALSLLLTLRGCNRESVKGENNLDKIENIDKDSLAEKFKIELIDTIGKENDNINNDKLNNNEGENKQKDTLITTEPTEIYDIIFDNGLGSLKKGKKGGKFLFAPTWHNTEKMETTQQIEIKIGKEFTTYKNGIKVRGKVIEENGGYTTIIEEPNNLSMLGFKNVMYGSMVKNGVSYRGVFHGESMNFIQENDIGTSLLLVDNREGVFKTVKGNVQEGIFPYEVEIVLEK